jgi:hypothetical protein
MENQPSLFKGELMEEHLRNYFLNNGYYVVRGIKFKYDNIDITDIDLYLYGRSSSLTRQRINVDIKNKKSPQAFERILWANGLMKILNFDACIVATVDHRPILHSFAQLHGTTILDGAFLAKLRTNSFPDRLTEEDLCSELSKYSTYKAFDYKDWRGIYELSKSKLLAEQDYSGFNSALNYLLYFFEVISSHEQKREIATRMVYLILSHLLIIIDFITKDIAFLEPEIKEKKLTDGFKFGNLGKDGVDKIISMANQIAGNKSANAYRKSLDEIPVEILVAFFNKNETAKNLFPWAKEFGNLGFNKNLILPTVIDAQLKGVITVILDYAKIERKKFFDLFPTTT